MRLEVTASGHIVKLASVKMQIFGSDTLIVRSNWFIEIELRYP